MATDPAALPLTPPVESSPPAPSTFGAKAKAFVTSFPFLVWVITRAAYLGMSWMSLTMVKTLWYHEESRHRSLQPWPWVDGLCRWDCGWFDRVAIEGYATVEHAKVFPLLSAIGAGVEQVTGLNHLLTFIIVSNLATLGAYVVVYKVFHDLEGEPAARFGLLAFTAFPFHYYSAAGYPESIMMFTTALAVWYARGNHHFRGAFALTVGFAARHLTLSGGAALLAGQIRERGWKRFFLSPAILALLIPWSFLAWFSWYLSVKTGDPLAWWTSRKIGWNDWVWYGARQVMLYVPYWDRPEYFYYLIFGIPMVAGGAGLAWMLRRDPKKYAEIAAFGLVLLAVVLSSGAAGMGRYHASNWACFLPIGVWLAKRPTWAPAALGLLWAFQGMWFFLFTHQWRVF